MDNYAPAPNRRGLNRGFRIFYASAPVFVLRLTVSCPNSRTERHRKAKIGPEVAHVTRDSVTTFKVKRSKVNLLLMS